MNHLRKLSLAAALGATLALAACGGDDSDDSLPVTPPTTTPPTTPPTAPPAAINDSVGAFIGYLAVLVTQLGDGEPLDIAAVTPPTSDTAEPTALQ